MQKTTKFLSLLIALLIMMISMPVLGVIVSLKEETRFELISNPSTSVSHAPILINNNTELDTFCFGQGTDGLSWATAHVIEDYEINAGGSGAALFIQNTDLFLIIRNITATNAGASVDAGIVLKNCTNVKITNCTTYSNGIHGISLQQTSNSIILDNWISVPKLRRIFNFNRNTTILLEHVFSHQSSIITRSAGGNKNFSCSQNIM